MINYKKLGKVFILILVVNIASNTLIQRQPFTSNMIIWELVETFLFFVILLAGRNPYDDI